MGNIMHDPFERAPISTGFSPQQFASIPQEAILALGHHWESNPTSSSVSHTAAAAEGHVKAPESASKGSMEPLSSARVTSSSHSSTTNKTASVAAERGGGTGRNAGVAHDTRSPATPTALDESYKNRQYGMYEMLKPKVDMRALKAGDVVFSGVLGGSEKVVKIEKEIPLEGGKMSMATSYLPANEAKDLAKQLQAQYKDGITVGTAGRGPNPQELRVYIH